MSSHVSVKEAGRRGGTATRKHWERLKLYDEFFASNKIFKEIFEDFVKEREAKGAS